MNLLGLASRLGEIMTHVPVAFDPACCLHASDHFSTCTACFDICPTGAVQPGTPPTLDAEACRHCFACLPVCPVGAWTAVDNADALLACTARLGVKTCEILCMLNPNLALETPSAAAAIRLRGCLAGLGVGTYLMLASQGMEQVSIRTEACADCPWQGLHTQVTTQVRQAQELLSLWGKADVLTTPQPVSVTETQKRPIYHASSPPLSRRKLFRGQAVEQNSPTEPEANAKPTPFHERLRVLQAIRQLPQPQAQEKTVSLAGLGFALVTVNNACTACGACARACPTGALQMETAVSSYHLDFSAQICIACDICSHVCAAQAITLTPDPPFDQVFGPEVKQTVRQGGLTPCRKCRTLFAAEPGVHLCPVCEFRRQHPFGSVMPPGLAVNSPTENVLPDMRRPQL